MKPSADVTLKGFSRFATRTSFRKRLCVGLLPWLIPTLLAAATANVEVDPFAFNPASVTIEVNDQVIWTWVSDFHSSTSDTGLWDSGVFNTGHVFTNTFTTAGSFPYFCVVHGFTGDVNVQGGSTTNQPPTVAITSPAENASFDAPASVPILATASDSDGTVTNVAFYDGATLLGATNNTPYTVTVTFALGNHALSAVATDDGGLSATSAVVNIAVASAHEAPSVTITNPAEGSIFGNTDGINIDVSASG
ncbi:MAG TPA: Ig-like domain-containing protein, partial [Verrucomicrobiae bacterium]|nr:Ig-like domain-containing protein [Verrucomicrobiae bacterium]